MEERGRGSGGSIFAAPLQIVIRARIRNHLSTHRPIIPHGAWEKWTGGSIHPAMRSIAPYRIFDISVPYPVDLPGGKIFDRFGRR